MVVFEWIEGWYNPDRRHCAHPELDFSSGSLSGVCCRRFDRSQDLHAEARGATGGLIARRKQRQDALLHLLEERARGIRGGESYFVPVRLHILGAARALVVTSGRLEHRECRLYAWKPFRSPISEAAEGFDDLVARAELPQNRRDLPLKTIA
jgi:hypothetical protein